MRNSLLILATAVVLSLPQVIFAADEDTACFPKCDQTHEACVAAVTSPNDAEADQARAACEEAQGRCRDACAEPAEKQPEEQQPPEQPQEQPQEQQQEQQPQEQPQGQ